jgi:nucleotide-binding universal stress UspA family protein
MIKDIMVHLDGTAADEARLAAASSIAEMFESHVIGLFLNLIPAVLPADGDGAGAIAWEALVDKARAAGDRTEATLVHRLARLNKPVTIRRFDVFNDTIGDIASREARSADTFITYTIKPNRRGKESDALVESVLFGSGRHLFLIADKSGLKPNFEEVLVAWNGSRESTRALAEGLPYLHRAKSVTVVVVDEEPCVEGSALLGSEAVEHLQHHGIDAELHHISSRDVGGAIAKEARRRKADLIVMGGYGHSRMREWLLGGATYELLRHAPVPLLIAH